VYTSRCLDWTMSLVGVHYAAGRIAGRDWEALNGPSICAAVLFIALVGIHTVVTRCTCLGFGFCSVVQLPQRLSMLVSEQQGSLMRSCMVSVSHTACCMRALTASPRSRVADAGVTSCVSCSELGCSTAAGLYATHTHITAGALCSCVQFRCTVQLRSSCGQPLVLIACSLCDGQPGLRQWL
jgi:hypothetical protein